MRISIIAAAVSATLVLGACSSNVVNQEQTNTKQVKTMQTAANNVLMKKSPLTYQAPQFDKLSIDDYEPAFAAGIAEHNTQIAVITNNPLAPTFENTIVAMEKSGELLTRVSKTFYNLASVISNDDYQRIEADMGPKLTAHEDNIYLNPTLFARVQTIGANKASLTPLDQRLVEHYYNNFVRAGAKLNDADKATVREINGQLSTLATEFSQNILKSFKNDTIVVNDKALLAGLSESEIASLASAAKKAGKDGYLITLVNTTRQPILGSLENRSLRKKIWQASSQRAMSTNGPVLIKLAQLRAQKAQLLGYPTWAAYVTADQMAKTPAAVYDILDDLAPKAVAKAEVEAQAIQEQITANGENFSVQPWDWAYYSEKVRKAKYDLDENIIKPYFELDRVLHDGLFFAMQKLYGITFKARKDLPVYHDDVQAFEVFNQDGSSIGLFYFDPYAREGKGGGAWMDEFVTQSELLKQKPVVYNVLNIPKPAAGQPTLLTFDEVTTLFHEFGHAAHGLFSQVKYPSLAGTATARDFVEFPSQFNEDWDINPEVIANYAKHYQTGEAIPKALLDKLLAAHHFNQGFDTTEYLAAALIDMEWHSITPDTKIDDVAAFEKKALAKHGIDFAPVPPRYKSAYFSHAFAGGYSAGYYAYLWTEVFAADAFAYMTQHDGLNRENGDKFRSSVLSMGNSKDLMQDYIDFRGSKPTTDALLKRRGLVD
ncbi:M3 family metallopeptidase [Paraglaciecola sp. L1A13]|uniref:M3 family metallopeptidase n=1 Tax=Paraglaciecola sp. L1A13 TaxID=2686359 RepID=UPI00131A91CA|nr:M3 family metallopeptidase [Paraglaciecola sp. L1A13]